MINQQPANLTMDMCPISHPLNATIRVPGSKSLTNRALLIAALAQGTTMLSNALFSDDSAFFTKALQTLGFDIILNPQNNSMIITGMGGFIPANQADLFIGNAGTAARFLTAFLTLGNGRFTLDGDNRMRERPIGDLVAALTQLGADVQGTKNKSASICPPIRINACGLPGGKARVSGNISSQFLSALLMAAPYASGTVEIEITSELNSKPYVDLTMAVMADFGVDVALEGYKRFLIHPSHYFPLSTYSIESDASAASYFFAAPAICGGRVRVENISRASKQGDIKFLEILERMGCTITESGTFIQVDGPAELIGADADLRDIPDTAQTLAVIAPFALSPTFIRGIASARFKETDRISSTCAELIKIGVRVEEHEDGMTIYPAHDFQRAHIQTYNDHRMAMAFSLIGLRVPGIQIENPGCVSKTFPDYFEVLEMLR